MAKKSHKHKSAGYYLRISFTSLLMATVVYVGGNYFVKPQYVCANSKSCTSDLVEEIDNNTVGIFQGHTVFPPKIDFALDLFKPSVLGTNAQGGEKHIYVDLSTQTLYAFEGTTKIMTAPVSSGKWGRTPVGNFHVWQKLRATRMAGGEGADAYDLPNVPYVMYFYHDFGLHGAYWHNNFGHPMSHGCVNMRFVDARDLFNWADGPTSDHLGTPVSVCNKVITPNKCVQEQPVS